MKRLRPMLILVLLTSCAALFVSANIEWARQNHIDYKIFEISELQWGEMADDPRSPCFFSPPNNIFILDGKYTYLIMNNVEFKRTYKDYCLDHELGHLREYLEGVPWHSKYAK